MGITYDGRCPGCGYGLTNCHCSEKSTISAAKGFEAEGPFDFTNDLTRQLSKSMDEFILKQFERHGYSEKEVRDLAIAEKITTVEHGNVTTYFVSDIAVFDIERISYDISLESEDYYKFTNTLVCRDRIPAVR